jgi:hypothetical protein
MTRLSGGGERWSVQVAATTGSTGAVGSAGMGNAVMVEVDCSSVVGSGRAGVEDCAGTAMLLAAGSGSCSLGAGACCEARVREVERPARRPDGVRGMI